MQEIKKKSEWMYKVNFMFNNHSDSAEINRSSNVIIINAALLQKAIKQKPADFVK